MQTEARGGRIRNPDATPLPLLMQNNFATPATVRGHLGDPLPKAVPLPGSLHEEWKRCGTPGCQCARGHLHGPYVSRRWREGGRQRRAYVPRSRVAEVRAAVAEWHQFRPAPWAARQALVALRRLGEEIHP
jgi:hypothetical protein